MPRVIAATRATATIVAVTCLVGLFLRAHLYLVNRSLWIDEAMLALNIVNRSLSELFQPLDYSQGAPVGFLLLQKVIVLLAGGSDYALRVLPFSAGIGSVPLMYAVSRRYSPGLAPVVSLGLFALCARLIYYSSELKQYSTDVFVTLVLLLLVPRCLERDAKPRAFVWFGLAAGLAVWFSHPAVFVATAAFLALGLTGHTRRSARRLLWLAAAAAAFALNLAFLYAISLRSLASDGVLLSYWRGSFAPMPPWSDVRWYFRALGDMLHDPAGLPTTVATVGLLATGALSFALRQWPLMVVLTGPFLLAVVASSLGKYPFGGRLLLFALPLLAVLIAEGVERLRTVLLNVNRWLAWSVFALSVLHLMYGPVAVAYHNILSPPLGEHVKPVLSHLREHLRDGDLVYVYYGAVPAFEFYAPQFELVRDYEAGTYGRNDPATYLQQIDRMRGHPRVWFVFSHNCADCIVNEERWIVEHLDRRGSMEGSFKSTGASLYLYDLRGRE